MKKILLLDIENLPKTETELLKYCSQYNYIYLVYAKTPSGFSLDGLVKLAPFISSGKLKVLKMPKMGKDAADFGLTFIAGQLSTQFKSSDVVFEVMSNDHSMEYVVDLLKIARFQANLISKKPLVTPQVVKEAKSEINVESLIYQYCEYLIKQGPRPSKLESLINSLKAILKVEEDVAKVLVGLLKKNKIIKFENNKPNYQDTVLQNYLKQLSITAETAESVGCELDQKLSNIRLRLMPFLNVIPEKRPKYLASFEVLLEKCVPKEQVSEILELLIKSCLITVHKREITYSPQLFGN